MRIVVSLLVGCLSVPALLGVRDPHPFHDGWRVFWTQQHGDNATWEVLPARDGDDD